MINYLKNTLLRGLILSAILLASCSDDDPNVLAPGSEGFFIINEGGFGNGNTSISFYDRETETVSNNLFATTNGIPLGDQAQSMTLHDGKGFIVVQNSGKIEVVDPDDLSILETISADIISPRYFVGLSSTKGYVSDWGADGVTGTVKVIDLVNYEVTATIAIGQGTNRLLLVGNLLYAVNAGGFGRDNTLKVIDTNTDQVITTTVIGDNPNSIVRDSGGNFWLAISGHTAFDPQTFAVIEEESTPGAIVKLDASGEETMRLTFTEVGFSQKPSNISINNSGNQLYFLYAGEIYTMSTSTNALPSEPFVSNSFYGFAVDPIDNTIIGCEAPDFSSSGNILIYSEAGDLLATHAVGIGPNGCTFK